MSGALTLFGRDGYSRASIEAIALEAGVSTRTIYNHFVDKAAIFETVIQESATTLADAQIAIIDGYLRKVTDLESDLVELGVALAKPMTEFATHFALVRHIHADHANIPQPALDAWRAAGQERVIKALSRHFATLAQRKLLTVGDPRRAAGHFMLLVSGAIPFHHGPNATRTREILTTVTGGVRAFLYGYVAR